tara:strand:- start:85 stop:789 length:705 start_codon:yes stop_codon:yes gene_type:complete
MSFKSILIFFIIFISFSYSQNYIDIVYLQNGSIIKGIIIEQVPDKYIKLKTADGSIFVYEMEIVLKTLKEEQIKKEDSSMNFKKNKLTSINGIGFIVGGVSSVSWEKYQNDNQSVNFTRLNFWTYRDYDYSEMGLGFGGGFKKYFLTQQSFSGLSFSSASDIFITRVADDDPWVSEAPYTSLALALSASMGFSIPLNKVRLEPALNVSYVLIIGGNNALYGLLVTPQINLGFLL